MKKADILIVEDDAVTASVINKYLIRNNYNVIGVAVNADEAFAFLEKNNPDLILMDIFLKDSIDGIEIAGIIRESKDIPVVYLTADSTETTIARAKITEPFGYLVKPVESKMLITNIELSIQKQSNHNKKLLEILKKANDELEQRVENRTSELLQTNQELLNEIRQRIVAEEALRKADKLATIGKMSAILAHEIRNPLNSIKINTDILYETLELPENKKRRLEIIQKEVTRLDNLVKDVLQFARQGSLVFNEFDLNMLIDSISSQLKHVFEQKKIVFENHADKIQVRGDSEKLRQVFLNLILNSTDAIDGKGLIEIYSSILKKDNTISIFIKDNGTGISPEVKLFEPFFTTKNTGTGLGLPISQNIIEQHGGTLRLFSSKPGESIFTINIPL